jgi:hypothetical protein
VATASAFFRPSATLGRPRAAGEHLPARPLHADHVRAQVRQDHAGVRARPDARDLDDLEALERTGSLTELERHGPIMARR